MPGSLPEPPPGGTGAGVGGPPPPEPPPPRRSRAPVVVAVLTLAGLVAAGVAVAVFTRGSDPCRDASFVSERFGYCLDVVGAWQADAGTLGPAQVDTLALPAAPGFVTIQATTLDPGTSLQAFADAVRSRDQTAGYRPTDPTPRTVDGVDALQWDVSAAEGIGTTSQAREIVFVRDDVGWRVQLGDTPASFPADAADLDRMLESWRFS